MFQFLVGTDRRDIVVRHDHRTKLTFPDRDIEYELVSADTSGEFEVLSLDARAGRHDERHAERARERGVLARPARRIVAEVAGQTYELDAGDSIKIHRELPHRFMNQSSADAELMIIISPPTF